MEKTKKTFTLPQRNHLARLFANDLSEHPVYGAMNPTLKEWARGGIKLNFIPLEKTTYEKLPPIEVGEIVKKDKEGNIIEEKYFFELEIPISCVQGLSLKFTREIKKNALDNL